MLPDAAPYQYMLPDVAPTDTLIYDHVSHAMEHTLILIIYHRTTANSVSSYTQHMTHVARDKAGTDWTEKRSQYLGDPSHLCPKFSNQLPTQKFLVHFLDGDPT